MVDLRSVRAPQNYLCQTTVMTARDEHSHNRVINWHPPPISDSERRLPRLTRTILAQLSSGWSNILDSYRAKIIPGTSSRWPSCNQAPHDTVLRPIDLWGNPKTIADFLGLPTISTSDNIHTQLATNNLHTTIFKKPKTNILYLIFREKLPQTTAELLQQQHKFKFIEIET